MKYIVSSINHYSGDKILWSIADLGGIVMYESHVDQTGTSFWKSSADWWKSQREADQRLAFWKLYGTRGWSKDLRWSRQLVKVEKNMMYYLNEYNVLSNSPMQALAKSSGKAIETTSLAMYGIFIECVRESLHFALAFSPIGDSIKKDTCVSFSCKLLHNWLVYIMARGCTAKGCRVLCQINGTSWKWRLILDIIHEYNLGWRRIKAEGKKVDTFGKEACRNGHDIQHKCCEC